MTQALRLVIRHFNVLKFVISNCIFRAKIVDPGFSFGGGGRIIGALINFQTKKYPQLKGNLDNYAS